MYLRVVFLTVGELGTYSVTMWEKVANCGFFGFIAAITKYEVPNASAGNVPVDN